MDSVTYNNLDRHGLKIQQKKSLIRKDQTLLPYLNSQVTHMFTFLMFKYGC